MSWGERQGSVLVPACHIPAFSQSQTVRPCVEAPASLMSAKSGFLLLAVSYPNNVFSNP